LRFKKKFGLKKEKGLGSWGSRRNVRGGEFSSRKKRRGLHKLRRYPEGEKASAVRRKKRTALRGRKIIRPAKSHVSGKIVSLSERGGGKLLLGGGRRKSLFQV